MKIEYTNALEYVLKKFLSKRLTPYEMARLETIQRETPLINYIKKCYSMKIDLYNLDYKTNLEFMAYYVKYSKDKNHIYNYTYLKGFGYNLFIKKHLKDTLLYKQYYYLSR